MALLTGTVTLGTNNVLVTPTGGVATDINVATITTLQVYASRLQPFLNLPSEITGTVFPPGAPVNDTTNIQWYLKINLNDGTFVDIPMGKITNQGSWVNTQAGAEVARAAVTAIL